MLQYPDKIEISKEGLRVNGSLIAMNRMSDKWTKEERASFAEIWAEMFDNEIFRQVTETKEMIEYYANHEA